MSVPSAGDSRGSREARLEQVLAECLRAIESGRPIDRDALSAEHPDLVDDLRSFFVNREAVERLAGPFREAAAPADTPTVGMPPVAGGGEASRIRYFADYELLEEIARGGMGVVYKARQVNLNRIVALKMILSGELATPEDVRRFYTEAEAAASLDHPGIVPIFEIGQHGGQHYFSMAFIEGQSLAVRISGGPFSPREAAEMTRRIATAVGYAHGRGVIHRDLKPGNVLLDSAGEPRVTDFGLARRVHDTSGMTQTGVILGTPSYMPPEQASGQADRIGPAADVYSLGGILYCLLTGRPPFQSANPLDTLRQVLTSEPVRPRQLNPDVPLDLDTIALKCLEKEPGSRYASAQDLSDELGRFLRGEPVVARPISGMKRGWRWCRRNPAVTSLAAAVLSLVLAVSLGSTAAALSFRRLANSERSARVEADLSAEESRQRLVKHYVASGVQRMNEGDVASSLPWFVEGLRLDEGRDVDREWIHRVRLSHLVSRCARPRRTWFQPGNVESASFSPDGRRVVLVNHRVRGGRAEVQIFDVESGRAVSPILRHGEYPILHAQFSPDGRRLVTAGWDRTARLWDSETGQELTGPLQHPAPVTLAAFSPSGDRLVTLCYQDHRGTLPTGEARLWDAATGQPLSPPLKHDDGHAIDIALFTLDGERVVTASRMTPPRIWLRDGRPAPVQLQDAGPAEHLAISGDGTRLLTSGPAARVWDMTTGRPLSPTLATEMRVAAVALSRDGSRAATLTEDGIARVWDAATGRPTARLSTPSGLRGVVTFDVAGRRLLVVEPRGVHVVDAESGRPTMPPLRLLGECFAASFSPQGDRLLTAAVQGYYRATGAVSHVAVWEAPDSEPATRLAESGDFYEVLICNQGRWALGVKRIGQTEQLRGRVWDLGTRRPMTAAFDLDTTTAVRGYELRKLDREGRRLAIVHNRNFNAEPDPRKSPIYREEGTVRVWNLATGKPVGPPIPHKHGVTAVAFLDEDRLMTGTDAGFDSAENAVSFWNIGTGQQERAPLKFDGPLEQIHALAGGMVVATSQRLVEGNRKWTVAIHDPRDGKSQTLIEPQNHIPSLALSRDDRWMAARFSGEFAAEVWDLNDRRRIDQPLQHSHFLMDAAFDSKGRRVLTLSGDQTARIWDTMTAKPLTGPMIPANPTGDLGYRAAFSASDRLAISLLGDHTAQVWDAATGMPVTPALALDSRERHDWWFPPDESVILAAGFDGTLHAWQLSPENRQLDDLRRTATRLSASRIDQTGGFVPALSEGYRQAWSDLESAP